MIASSMYNAAAGSATWEKNLDRLTIIFGLVFAVTIFAMMLVFPQGSFA